MRFIQINSARVFRLRRCKGIIQMLSAAASAVVAASAAVISAAAAAPVAASAAANYEKDKDDDPPAIVSAHNDFSFSGNYLSLSPQVFVTRAAYIT